MTRDYDVTDGLVGPVLPAHLYVHVPFCASKCSYCDFASISGASELSVRAVFRALRSNVVTWESTGLEGVLDSVYVGGGTPSLHADKVASLIEFIAEQFVIHPAAEITVEANPDSLTAEKVRRFAQAGVTRISVGVQSFDDSVLANLGRLHDAESAARACAFVVDAGLDLSLDLICGVPGQTTTSWAQTLERAAKTGAHHMSVYPLSIEEGTPLAVAISAELVDEPDPDAAAEMMLLAREALGYYGLGRYEVANYAESPRYESVHNTAYWTGRPYIGIGPGAHGMLDADTARSVGMLPLSARAARVRYAGGADIDQWLTGRGDTVELLSAEEAAREDVMLGLRLVRGVPVSQVESAGLTPVLHDLEAEGLCECVDGRWRTTDRGWLLGNEVFARVWDPGSYE